MASRRSEPAAPSGAVPASRPVQPHLIQPHGFLLAVDPETSIIRVASANLWDHVGVAAGTALGSTLAHVLGPAADRVPPLTTVRGDLQVDPLPVDLDGRSRYDVATHRSGDLVVLEFEPAPDYRQGFTAFHEALRRALDPMIAATDVATLCGTTADQVRSLTGFDEVLVCQFDHDATGIVVAESHSAAGAIRPPDTWATSSRVAFLGPAELEALTPPPHAPVHLLPETRALLLDKRVRTLVDAAAPPVGLVYEQTDADVGILDLTRSDLRIASPAYLDYLRALGVGAETAISVVTGDGLWGVVLCRHPTRRFLPHGVRAVCETLARTLSLQLDVQRARATRDRALAQARVVGDVVEVLGRPVALEPLVAAAAPLLTTLVDADAVLVRLDGESAASGDLVEPGDVAEVIAHVAAIAVDRAPGGVWSTENLAGILPPLASGATIGTAGALAVPLRGGSDDLVVWLRRAALGGRPGAPNGAAPAADADPSGVGRVVDVSLAQDAAFAEGAALAENAALAEDGGVRARWWKHGEIAGARMLGEALPAALLRRTRRELAVVDADSRAERAVAKETTDRLEHDLQRKLRLESLGKLAGGVAHDFNNLLSVILSNAEFVDDAIRAAAVGSDGEHWSRVSEETGLIMSATERAAGLTRQLLSFARREVTQPRPLDLNQVIRDVEVLLRRTLGQQVDLQLTLCAEPAVVVADPEQLERVLVNLAVNGRDAMPSGGRLIVTTYAKRKIAAAPTDITPATIEGSATSTTDATDSSLTSPSAIDPVPLGTDRSDDPDENRWVVLRVRDTGSGIPADVIDRVFDPFFTTKGDGEGSGLGLATVHGIVSQAAGRITIESEPGAGTTVSIALPASDAEVEVVAAPAPAAPESTRSRVVLVVEDEDAIRDATRRILRAGGYEVLSTATGDEAVATAAAYEGRIDILLSDVSLPGMPGREAARIICQARPEIRVVLMSGFTQNASIGLDDAAREVLLIDKPFTRAELLAKLAESV